MPGEIARLMTCQWTNDRQHIVLEVPDEKEGSKATYDSARCTWAQLLRELEEGKVVDPTINNHELLAPVSDSGIKLRILKNINSIMISMKCTGSFMCSVRFTFMRFVGPLRSTAVCHQAKGHTTLFPVWRFDFGFQIYQLCFCVYDGCYSVRSRQ